MSITLIDTAAAPADAATTDRTRPLSAQTPMLRVNAIPGRRLADLDLAAGLATIVAAEQEKTAVRDAACAEIYAVVPGRDDVEHTYLLTTKRAVFNNRPTTPAPNGLALPAAASAYLRADADGRAAAALINDGYYTHLAHERSVFAEQIAQEDFQLALALNSPNVLDACLRYARSAGKPDSRDRKSERGILQHLSRAMVRTSPLSRFTAVGFGSWTDHAPALDSFLARTPQAHSFTHVDRGLFTHLVTGILRPPADGGPLPAVLDSNRTIKADDGNVRFQQNRDGRINLVSAPLTDPLRLLLTLTSTGAVRTEALILAVAERQDTPVERAAGLVTAAVRAQILVAGPVLDEQAENPLPAARVALLETRPELITDIDALAADVEVIRVGDVRSRLQALGRIDTLSQRLNAVTSTPAKVHVNEDYVLDPFAVSSSGFDAALDDLAQLTEFYSLFDRHQVRRVLLAAAVRQRHGAGASVSLIDSAEALIGDVDAMEGRLSYAYASSLGGGGPELTELLRQRVTARTAVMNVIDARGTEQVELDPTWLSGLAAALPDRFRATPASHCLIVQADAGLLVVNDCHAGRSLLGMRFLGHDRALGGDAHRRAGRHVQQVFGGTHRLIEDRGLHQANINHRVQVLQEVITPEGWLDLRLVHDAATDTLSLVDSDGAPVRPVTLGMKWTDMMPAPLRIAMWLVDSGLVPVDLHERANQLAATTAKQTVTHPRIRAGQVVMQRRRWFPGEDFPTRNGDDADHLVAITRWRAAHNVPDQVVAKTPEARIFGRATEPLGDYLAQRRKEKPQYLDLASALFVRTLPKLLERRSPGYLEEAVPAVHDGVHAQEWAIEFDRPAYGTFTKGPVR